MRRILVVANQTLGGDHLAAVIAARGAEPDIEFTLLVPATHRTDVVVALAEAFAVQGGMRPPVPTADDDVDAAGRLTDGLSWMRGLGVSVDGRIGEHDPVRAVRDLLADQPCDEIIVSTLPRGHSSWLHHDLPNRIERASGLPMTVVSAEHPVPA
ncbi:MAG TPA: hypothetical protein VIJ00_05280 [Nakamurella sp.]